MPLIHHTRLIRHRHDFLPVEHILGSGLSRRAAFSRALTFRIPIYGRENADIAEVFGRRERIGRGFRRAGAGVGNVHGAVEDVLGGLRGEDSFCDVCGEVCGGVGVCVG
jgi:hypothetical protein